MGKTAKNTVNEAEYSGVSRHSHKAVAHQPEDGERWASVLWQSFALRAVQLESINTVPTAVRSAEMTYL